MTDLYRSLILEQAPRVLSLMDRDAFSATAGCGDRTYWAWKFVDYPGARFQESLCVLGFLYATDLPGSPYHHSARLLEWIELGLNFWCSIQYPDGSFDEAYPYERSLAAVSFTSFYVGEAMLFLGDACPAATRDRVRAAMQRAGEWLLRNDEHHGFLSNHLAAAAAALLHIHRITGDARFHRRSRYFIAKILARQSSEGWYDEYSGADPGYQTHGSFYLARYCQLNPDEELAASLARSMRFLAVCVHPDGSIGGEYASRNTQTYYPAAFEMMAEQDETASWIAAAMRESVATAAAAGLRTVDVYNFYPFLNNTVFAYLACAQRARAATPREPEAATELVWFPKAGIARIRKPAYDAWIGTAKGGVVKVFDRAARRRVYSDCGYIGRLKTGAPFASQSLEPGRQARVSAAEISLAGGFYIVSRPTMTPVRFLAFRMFTLTANRIPGFAQWLKSLLVKVLIHGRKPVEMEFTRTLRFDESGVTVRDRIQGDGNAVESLRRGEVFTTIHMGSSQYFIPNELERNPGEDPPIDPRSLTAGVTLERTVTVAREYA
jgi:hypothetical protein